MSIGYLAYLWAWGAGNRLGFVAILYSSEEKPPSPPLADVDGDAQDARRGCCRLLMGQSHSHHHLLTRYSAWKGAG